MCRGEAADPLIAAVASEVEQTQKVRNQGRPGGLFRACMDEIRSSHTLGQSLRNALVAGGALTDEGCYTELLVQFYVATKALEQRMGQRLLADRSQSKLTAQVAQLGYAFTAGYENDLRSLLGPNWRQLASNQVNSPAQWYVDRLHSATDIECCAAAFILHGPLVIGGGAALKSRVEKSFGNECTSVFESVVGAKRGGRSGRRKTFVRLYDTLLDGDADGDVDADADADADAGADADGDGDADVLGATTSISEARHKEQTFDAIVRMCGEFMDLNNQMMAAVQQRPWWRKYVDAVVVGIASVLAWKMFEYCT